MYGDRPPDVQGHKTQHPLDEDHGLRGIQDTMGFMGFLALRCTDNAHWTLQSQKSHESHGVLNPTKPMVLI